MLNVVFTGTPTLHELGELGTGPGPRTGFLLSDRCDHMTGFQPMERRLSLQEVSSERSLPFLGAPLPPCRGDRGAEQPPTAQAGCRRPGVREQSPGGAGADIRACTAYLLSCLSLFYFGFCVICRVTL